MHEVFKLIERLADTDSTILIRGESNGSGFSWRAAEASAPAAPSTHRHGRGIALIRSYCRHLRWENEGRVAEAEIDLPTLPAND